MVGAEIAQDLSRLQDRMDSFPLSQARETIEQSLGRKLDDLYVSFDDAIAAASIAQVHPAEVMRGRAPEKVAVKVIRPGVRKRFANDLESYFLIARLQERFIPSSKRLKPMAVIETANTVHADILDTAALGDSVDALDTAPSCTRAA